MLVEDTVLSPSINPQLNIASRNNFGILTSVDELVKACFHPHDPDAMIDPIVKYSAKADFLNINKVKLFTELMRSRS